MFYLYRPLEANEEIVIGADVGEGVSYCAAVGISKRHKDVPLIYHARVESTQFGYELDKMGSYIKLKTGELPLIAVERNIGAATISKLRDLQYPLDRLYKQKTFDKVINEEVERIGWNTDASNRRKMLDDLALSLRNYELRIYHKQLLTEMLTFVVNERTGQPKHERGKFDDLIMALAIGWQMMRYDIVSATWAPSKPVDTNPRVMPATAQGFIVESFQEKKDWRNPV